MDSSITNHQKNVATVIQISVFSKIVIPLGNFIVPIVLWAINKEKSSFIDNHGKQAINFQLSILIYHIVLGIAGVSLFAFNIGNIWDVYDNAIHSNYFSFENFHVGNRNFFQTIILGCLFIGLKVLELVCVISAAIKANRGEYYQFPLSINFLKFINQ
ncbi:hypothetical protein NBRC110019_06550 [Neptunitalea chrysea]|uniref:DUF4870 domain-containing protein n=1 Tax=Neptunitalea chrysea TaxID=1647581 RepID=A0A9W6B316_9FLAO|nr:DUF4870 domain-containing protein [Neptunitalea chrysea]GLB51616.1 hypothetical protein NBRC110019_06550 [Neptunitalea chrysea]